MDQLVGALASKLPQPDVDQLAGALAPKLPQLDVDQLAIKLTAALAKQASQASGNGSLLDVFARGIADRLPHMPKLEEMVQRLDDLIGRRIGLAVGAVALVACLALLGGVALFRPGHSYSAVTAPFVPPPVIIVVGPGGERVLFDPQSVLGMETEQMGKKEVLDQPIPNFTLPGQKVEPCNPGLGEKAINGNCWAGPFKDIQPPCGLLFRSGNECYRPVAADPQKPVGLTPINGQPPAR